MYFNFTVYSEINISHHQEMGEDYAIKYSSAINAAFLEREQTIVM